MKNSSKSLVLVLLLGVIVGVGSVTMAYSAMTSRLDINGYATMNSRTSDTTWKVQFENLSEADLIGSATVRERPTLKSASTSLGTFKVDLNTIGDGVIYNFDVANRGDIDAKLSSITIPTPVCTGTGDNATADATLVCSNLTYSLTYNNNTAISADDELLKGESKGLKLTLKYTGSTLPQNTVNISGLDISLIYTQKD